LKKISKNLKKWKIAIIKIRKKNNCKKMKNSNNKKTEKKTTAK